MKFSTLPKEILLNACRFSSASTTHRQVRRHSLVRLFFTLKLFSWTMRLFSHNETNLGHNETILLIKVSLWIAEVSQRVIHPLKSTEVNAREWHNEIILLCPMAETPCATGIFDKKKRTKVAIPIVS